MQNELIDGTHSAVLESWVESANDPASEFPIQNLPVGRFRREPGETLRIGVAIGDRIIDLRDSGFIDHWSARDIQAWEYQPLGPFLAKNFATTISPWIVTAEALEPFRVPFARPEGDPDPLPYLDSDDNRSRGAFDVELEVWLQTAGMRGEGIEPCRLSRSKLGDAYWTAAQLIAHHTVNGCNLAAGDLLGTGTLSGPRADQGGSLLELTQGGTAPLRLPNGETRTFLEDGDTVILRGHCERSGYRRIGFGECSGTVLAARTGRASRTPSFRRSRNT